MIRKFLLKLMGINYKEIDSLNNEVHLLKESIDRYKKIKRENTYDIEKAGKLNFISENPYIKERIVFHGACLSCVTPIKKGCGACQGCMYSNFNDDLPSLMVDKNSSRI